jgi:hypothetical protein
LLLAAGGVAFATIPDSNGTITGCYNRTNGNLRIVDSGNDCRQNENAINWNQRGVPGPTGATGPVGPPGPPGGGAGARLPELIMSGGESRVLLTKGALTLTARCSLSVIVPGGADPTDLAEVLISTNQDGAAFAGSATVNPNRDRLTTTTPEQRRLVARVITNPDQPSYRHDTLSAAAPDGTRLNGFLYVGINVIGQTDKCLFGGEVFAR